MSWMPLLNVICELFLWTETKLAMEVFIERAESSIPIYQIVNDVGAKVGWIFGKFFTSFERTFFEKKLPEWIYKIYQKWKANLVHSEVGLYEAQIFLYLRRCSLRLWEEEYRHEQEGHWYGRSRDRMKWSHLSLCFLLTWASRANEVYLWWEWRFYIIDWNKEKLHHSLKVASQGW